MLSFSSLRINNYETSYIIKCEVSWFPSWNAYLMRRELLDGPQNFVGIIINMNKQEV